MTRRSRSSISTDELQKLCQNAVKKPQRYKLTDPDMAVPELLPVDIIIIRKK
jgi:hypothetical protein